MAARSSFIIAALATGACGRVGFGERPDSRGEWTISDSCSTCSVGLVAHWPFDETSGLIARDVVGGHDAMMMGTELGWSSGIRGGAAAVTRGYGIVSWDLPADIPTAFTIAMWHQPKPDSADYDRYFGSYYWNGSDHGAIEMDNFLTNGLRCIAHFGGSWQFVEINDVFSPTDWRHVACMFDGSELRIYGNGTSLATRPNVPSPLVATEPLAVAIGATAYPDNSVQNPVER